MPDFYFAMKCEYKDDGEQMILIGNAEKVSADDLPSASRHYRAKHRLQLGWDEKERLFKVVRIVED